MSPPAEVRPIGVLVPIFPLLSESFVTGEVRRLKRRGLDVRPVVLAPSRHAHSETLATLRREEGISPYYVHDPGTAAATLRAVATALRHPVAASRLAAANARLPVLPGASKAARLAKAMLVRRWMARNGIERLHCHWTPATDIALLLREVYGTPYSISAHAIDIYDDPRATGTGVLRQKLLAAEFVATCTAGNRAHLIAAAPEAASKIHLVYHGLDLSLFDGRRSGGDDGPPLVVSVGRLVPKKGFATLLDACRAALDAGVALRCVIIGDGPNRPNLEAMRATLGLENEVTLIGELPHEQVRDWMGRADLFVLCPEGDQGHYGIPNVLFEAMAMRTAVVAKRISDLEELITHGDNGLLVDSDQEITPALVALLSDGSLRERLAARARRTAERFDADALIGDLVALMS